MGLRTLIDDASAETLERCLSIWRGQPQTVGRERERSFMSAKMNHASP